MHSIVNLLSKLYNYIINHKNTIHVVWVFFAAIVFALFTMCRHNNAPVMVLNPYESVNWDATTQHKANFHAHTTQSDGNYPPHEVVDQYHQMGYTILALTDHDRVVHPWTGFSELHADYENRDPDGLGMMAIVENELSQHHHALSLFTDFQAEKRCICRFIIHG